MLFNSIIENPPYQGDLYARIVDSSMRSLCKDGEVIVLSPQYYFTDNTKYQTLGNHIYNFYNLSEETEGQNLGFDIDLGNGTGLGIFTLRYNENPNKLDLTVEGTRRRELESISNDSTMWDNLIDKFNSLPKMNTVVFKAIENEKRKRTLIYKINKDKWYIGLPSVKGHRHPKTGKIKWDYFTFITLSMTEPKKGEIDDWSYVAEFDTYEEAKKYIDYLNSDIAMFTLWINCKNNLPLYPFFNKVPYFVDESILSENERKAISKIMENFGNKYFIEKSIKERGKVNFSNKDSKSIHFDYNDSVGTTKLF